ncbi:MAG: hypothetical protein GXO60_01445 [Epsilonproteobacteria bacterium]|nr:hypothetical protein [Campylobacterota bacterium]
MKKLLLLLLFISFSSTILNAENNNSKNETNSTKIKTTETNGTKEEDLIKKQIQEQMKREEKYAKEQKFYQGDEYDLSAAEINEKSLSSLPSIEPDYDFNMDDAYSDEQ